MNYVERKLSSGEITSRDRLVATRADIDLSARGLARSRQARTVDCRQSKGIVLDFAAAARVKVETLRTDPVIFDVWGRS